MSDRTQTPEAPEPERKPAVIVDPAPGMAPTAPVGGLALGQLGSVDAVIALQQSSGNQAVDSVMRGRADASEALPGALGAALAGTRPAAKPAAPKPAATHARRGADPLGSLLRNAAANRPSPGARAAQSQSPFAVDAGAATGGGFGGFAGAGFVGPAGFETAVASFGGPAAATAGHRVAAVGGGAAADPDEGSGGRATAAAGVNSGAHGADEDEGRVDDDEMVGADPGDDEGDDADGAEDSAAETGSSARPDPGDPPPLIRLRARLLGGERIPGDRFAGEGVAAIGWVDLDAGRAAHEAARASWVRRQRGSASARPRGGQPPPGEDPGERRRRVDMFRDMAGTGVARSAGPERSLLLVADAIGDEEEARARNDATCAQLLAWQGQAGET